MKPSDSTESFEAGSDAALDELKVEVAQELGLDWRLGGHLGGQMVKRLVEKAEAALKKEWEG
jgi:hypothetical protein